MKAKVLVRCFLFLSLVAALLLWPQGASENGPALRLEDPAATDQLLVRSFGSVPLSFEANQGQADAQVKYLSRNSAYTVFLTSTEAVMSLEGSRDHADTSMPAILRMKLIGANEQPHVAGEEELQAKSSYFIGGNPDQWRTGVPNYAKVRYRDVYPGIDLVYYGNPHKLEHDFVVAPGASPETIRLGFEGADRVEIDEQGDLVLQVAAEQVRFEKPIAYRETADGRQIVQVDYVLRAEGQAAFHVAAYDATRPLIIDPVLSYSTYLGGSRADNATGIAVDAAGSVYVVGSTGSMNFPTEEPINPDSPDFAAFVTKFNAAGDALIYSTYLGGTGTDQAAAIALDSAGNAYVTGQTRSTGFPTTPESFQPAFAGVQDVFITKLNAAGDTLLYSTYVGSSFSDGGSGIAVDAAGNAYVTGLTDFTNFPTKNPIQNTLGGGMFDPFDAFVLKLHAEGDQLVYSTYLGGSERDIASDITVDAAGNAYVIGVTRSTDFPIVNTADPLDPIQISNGGGNDVFVTKLNAVGNMLVYSTYLGGSSTDFGIGIAVDASGNVYVTGSTSSANFPIVDTADPADPIQLNNAGSTDAFVSKLNAAGNGLVYSTFLGGTDSDGAAALAVDASGNAYVTGSTSSIDFPLVEETQLSFGGGRDDAFVAKLNSIGNLLDYSSYLGGDGIDGGAAIALDSSGTVFLAGHSDSSNFPVVSPFQGIRTGASDAIVTEITGLSPPGTPVISDGGIVLATLLPTVSTVSPLSIISVFGQNFSTDTILFPNLDDQGRLDTILGGTCLMMNGEALPIFAITPGQINAQASAAQVLGPASFTVVTDCGAAAAISSAPLSIEIGRPHLRLLGHSPVKWRCLLWNRSLRDSSCSHRWPTTGSSPPDSMTTL